MPRRNRSVRVAALIASVTLCTGLVSRSVGSAAPSRGAVAVGHPIIQGASKPSTPNRATQLPPAAIRKTSKVARPVMVHGKRLAKAGHVLTKTSAGVNAPLVVSPAITFGEFPTGSGPAEYNTTYGQAGLTFCTQVSGSNFQDYCLGYYQPSPYGDLPQTTAVAGDTASPILAAASVTGQLTYSVGAFFTYRPTGAQYPTNKYSDGTYVLADSAQFDLVCLPGMSGSVYANWTVGDGAGGFGIVGETYTCTGAFSVQTIAHTFPTGLEFYQLFTDLHTPKTAQPQFGIDNVEYEIAPHGPARTMEGGGVNPSAHTTTCFGGDPVNCATGTLSETAVVSAVSGRGPFLNLTRTYNSDSASKIGPLGYGWTDSYAPALTTDASGNVTITQENGSTIGFTRNSSGGYVPAVGVLGSLTAQSDGTVVFTRKPSQTKFTFSATGQLMSESDRNGITTTLTYTGGRLDHVTDASGRLLSFAYTGSLLTSVTDPLGRVTQFGYDSNSNLTSVTDPMNRKWQYRYDANHLMTSMTDPRGGQTTTTFDGSNRVVQQIDPAGLVTQWAYSGDAATDNGGITTLTDPHGNITQLVYEDLELLASTKAYGTPDAVTTTFTYDPATYGQAQIENPNRGTTLNIYDADGNLTSTSDPLNNTTTYTYDGLDNKTSEQLPDGETTTYAYDVHGNLTSITDPLTKQTTYAHGDSAHPGDITSMTDADGRVTSYSHDAYGDVTTITTTPAAGVTDVATQVYDADGELLCTTTPEATATGVVCPPAGGARVAGTTTTTYDADGEVLSTTDPIGHQTSTTYDNDGNALVKTDGDGNTTSTTYDADNRRITVVSGANGTAPSTTHAAFDLTPGTAPCGTGVTGATYCATTTDANGNATVNYYNARNLLIQQTQPSNRITRYTYDGDANQLSLTDPSGRTTTSSYDKDDRLVSVVYSDGVTPNVTYTFDEDGRRTSMVDGTGTTTYAYDADSRTTQVTNGANNAVSYSYDGAGDVTTITYPNNHAVTRVFDGARELTSVADWSGHTTRFAYNHDGHPTSETQPNGDTVATSYDADGAMTGSTNQSTSLSNLDSVSYVRDANDQVTQETDIVGAGSPSTSNFGYTALNEVKSNNTTTYSYDANGNPTTFAGQSQTFNTANELTTRSTSNFLYDSNGNRTQQLTTGAPTINYSYDQANRLTAVGQGGYLVTLPVTRIEDTTSGSGYPGAGATLAAGGTLTVQVTGHGGIPASGVKSALLRITEETSSSATTLTAYPADASLPPTATIITNTALLKPSRARTVQVALALSAAGQINIHNSAGNTNVAVDVVGYYAMQGNGYTPVTPTRLVDTRTGSGNTYAGRTLAANTGTLSVPIAGTAGVPSNATSVTVALTAVNNTASGSLTVYPAGSTPPSNPSMYLLASESATQELTVPLGTSPAGAVVVANGTTAKTDVTLDLLGYTTTAGGAGYTAVVPARIADTRASSGYGYAGQHITASGTLTIQATGNGGIPSGATAAVLTLSVPTSSTTTTLTAYPAGSTRPTTTAIAFKAGDPPTAELTVPLSSSGAFTLYNSAGTTDVTVDVLGYFSGQHVTYTYDGNGLRASRNSNSSSQYVWDVANSVPELMYDGTTSYIYGPRGQVIEQIDGGGTASYVFTDNLGSTRALTSTSGAVTASYSYDAYGTVHQSGAGSSSLQYAGGLFDSSTGLTNFVHRDYDSQTGQFISRDPLEQNTHQAYTYSNDNSVNLSDPLGLGLWPWTWSDKTLANVGIALGGLALAATGVGLIADTGLVAAAGVTDALAASTGEVLTADAAESVTEAGVSGWTRLGQTAGFASAGTGVPPFVRACRDRLDATCATDAGLLLTGAALAGAGLGGLPALDRHAMLLAGLGEINAIASTPGSVDWIAREFLGGEFSCISL